MPAIRDGRGKLTVYETEPPPAVPSGPIERDRVSEARMADFAAERARQAERAKPRTVREVQVAERQAARIESDERRQSAPAGSFKTTPADQAASRKRGTARMLETRTAATEAREEDAVPRGPDGPDARDRRAQRRAAKAELYLPAIRETATLFDAAGRLGITRSVLDKFVRDLRRRGELPADIAELLHARATAGRARAGTSKVEASEPLVDTHSSSTKPSIEARSVKPTGEQRAPLKHSAQIAEPAAIPIEPEPAWDGAESAAQDLSDLAPEPAPGIVRGHRSRNIFPPDSTPEAGGGPVADGMALQLHIDIESAEMASWSPERIAAFFGGLSKMLQAYHQLVGP